MRLILTKYQHSFTKGKIVKDSIILFFYVLRLVKPQIYNIDHRNKSNNNNNKKPDMALLGIKKTH